jgi:hypothetical protein
MYRLHAVTDIRQGTRHDDTHRVIEIGLPDLVGDLPRIDPSMNGDMFIRLLAHTSLFHYP